VVSSMNFLKNDSCRSVQLLSYFGQNSYDCGNCDVCIKANHTNNINEKEMIIQIIQFLQFPKNEEECLVEFKIEKNTLRQVLKKLLLDGKIKIGENKYSSSF
jgi:superfamily II DNA helicase RecQ